MKMNTNRNAMFGGLMALTLLGTLAPITATAQDDHDRDRRDRRDQNYNNRNDHDSWGDHWSDNDRRDWLAHHRRDSKNEWRNIAIGAGALGALGFLTGDNFLGFTGTAGALYSLNRYDQDRRSENREDRVRAAYFARPYFYRDGVRYDRKLVRRNGERYYQFVRHDRD